MLLSLMYCCFIYNLSSPKARLLLFNKYKIFLWDWSHYLLLCNKPIQNSEAKNNNLFFSLMYFWCVVLGCFCFRSLLQLQPEGKRNQIYLKKLDLLKHALDVQDDFLSHTSDSSYESAETHKAVWAPLPLSLLWLLHITALGFPRHGSLRVSASSLVASFSQNKYCKEIKVV